jgi:serine O-acetyltransferase
MTVPALVSALRKDFECLGYPHSLTAPAKISRCVVSPSMRAVALMRASQGASARVFPLVRLLLIRQHAIDIGRDVEIGEAFYLPHPVGIVIASGVRIGRAVTIYHHVTLGQKDGGVPTVGPAVTIYPGSVVVGTISIGEGAIIGANSFVSRDVPPGGVVRGSVGGR